MSAMLTAPFGKFILVFKEALLMLLAELDSGL